MRLRYNNALGTLGAALLTTDTTITFAAAPPFSTIVAPDYIPLVLDPPVSTPNVSFEVAWLTAYTAGATTGTIARGKDGTTAAAHANGVSWAHGPLAADVFYERELAQMPSGVVGETIPRRLVNHNWTFGVTSANSYLFAVSLPQGVTIGHLNAWFNGASTTQTHFWMGLCDSNRNLLAATADQGSTAVAAGNNSLAIATTAAGAATSYVTPYNGMYYIHLYLAAAAVPTMPTNVSVSAATGTGTNPWQAAPVLAGSLSSGNQQATPPAFPFQFSSAWANTYDALGYCQVAT